MGQPKALLRFRNKTFIFKLISDYREAKCDPIVVVVGEHADQIKAATANTGVHVEINQQPEYGPLSSLQIGIRALPSNCNGFFFCPVDHPAIEVRTLLCMLDEWDFDPDLAVRAIYQGRGGHPALLGRRWIKDVLAQPLSSNMRELFHQYKARTIILEVDDPGILLNVDTLEDYNRLIESLGGK